MGALNSDGLTFSHGRTGGIANSYSACGSDDLPVGSSTHMPEGRTQSVGALNSDELTFSHGRTGGSANSGADAPSLKHRSPPGQARTAVMGSSKPDSDESDFSSLSDHNLLTFGGCTEG